MTDQALHLLPGTLDLLISGRQSLSVRSTAMVFFFTYWADFRPSIAH